MTKVLDGEILAAEPGEEKRKAHEAKVRGRFWQTIRKAASRIPFIEDVVAAYFCALDPSTPRQVRVILFAALAYFVMPADLIPDFIAGFGFADDASVLGASLAAVRGHLRPAHYDAARAALRDPGMAGQSGRDTNR